MALAQEYSIAFRRIERSDRWRSNAETTRHGTSSVNLELKIGAIRQIDSDMAHVVLLR